MGPDQAVKLVSSTLNSAYSGLENGAGRVKSKFYDREGQDKYMDDLFTDLAYFTKSARQCVRPDGRQEYCDDAWDDMATFAKYMKNLWNGPNSTTAEQSPAGNLSLNNTTENYSNVDDLLAEPSGGEDVKNSSTREDVTTSTTTLEPQEIVTTSTTATEGPEVSANLNVTNARGDADCHEC